jgi:hypothetical protein
MARQSLARLERIRQSFGAVHAQRKVEAIGELARTRLRTARDVRRLHEVLCFIRAYPDDARVLHAAASALAAFSRRPDLREFRDALAHSGIAGTTNWFPYFFPTAAWLVAHWPQQLRFDRHDSVAEKSLASALPVLVTAVEAAALRELHLPGYAAVDRVRARGETDAAFLVRRVLAMPGDAATREAFYDAINPSCELLPAAGTPSRTLAHYPCAPVVFRRAPLRRERPDLRRELARTPRDVRVVPAAQGRALVDLARGAMVTRARDLDAFAHGDERDVLLVDDGDGLAFTVNGVLPERRAPVAAIFGGLTLQNGVPIGYLQADCVGAHAALSFNPFDTFRGGEAAWTFARLLAALRHVFGATSFSIEPYQLGAGNEEGLASGAWWFYYKLGFRPRDAAARRLAGEEVAHLRKRPGYRSSIETLRRLAQRHLFFDAEPAHPSPLPPLAQVGLRAAAHLASLAGADRERAVALAERAAQTRLGQRSLRGFDADERRAWSQWAPLVALLPLEHWWPQERAALVEVIGAKGGRSERGYVQRFAAHDRLQRELWRRMPGDIRRVAAGSA